MKFRALALVGLVSFNSFAAIEIPDHSEIILDEEVIEMPHVKIEDVKELISNMGAENTCMDEYLKRRKQLIVKLSLSPATIVAGTYVGTIGVGLLGVGVASALAVDPLAGVILGMGVGFFGTGTGTITDTSITAFQLADIDRILKALAEQHLNQPGKKSAKLFAKYAKKSETPVNEQQFFEKLLELDQNGELCDGSLVKKPRLASGKRLKHKIARSKHLASSI